MQLSCVCFPLRVTGKRYASNYLATGFHKSVCVARTLNAFGSWICVGAIGEVQQTGLRSEKNLKLGTENYSVVILGIWVLVQLPSSDRILTEDEFVIYVWERFYLSFLFTASWSYPYICFVLCRNHERKLLAFKLSWDRWMKKDMHLIHPTAFKTLWGSGILHYSRFL